MKKKRITFWILAGLISFAPISITSCKSSGYKPRKHKKLKRNKPIPCPVKDC